MNDNNIFEDGHGLEDNSVREKTNNEQSCNFVKNETQASEAVNTSKETAVNMSENGCDTCETEKTETAAGFERSTERTEVYINGDAHTKAAPAADLYPKMTVKKRKKSKYAPIAIAVALCVVLSGAAAFGGVFLARGIIGNGFPASTHPSVILQSTGGPNVNGITNTDSTGSQNGTYASVAASVSKSVVEIRTETVSTSSIFSQYITKGAGSGVIITSDGYIVTNNHVIEKASTVTVITNDGSKYPAEVIGYDSESDIAVIKIDATGLTPAVIGDSTKLVVGQEVIAIGNPLGSLGGTVTNGIISALAREITIDGTQMTLLQTNAAINPGNSGGGLFNMTGELVGIVNAKSSGSGIEGLGFAIPSNTASSVVEQLINYGYVRGRVSLGITYMDISDSYTAMTYRVNTLGMYILESRYTDELKIGDRVTAVNGEEITYGSDLKLALKDCKVGDKITVTVVRDGKYVDVEVECHEYVPGKNSEDVDKTEQDNVPSLFKSPFSWFGY